ncbi:MAG: SEC-C metal-binding domain-containing protein [Pseudomonadota bacterium]
MHTAGGASCESHPKLKAFPFETISKRRRGFPSETRVKKGVRIVHGNKQLVEKLGRNDPCPCGSGRRFQALLPEIWTIRRL